MFVGKSDLIRNLKADKYLKNIRDNQRLINALRNVRQNRMSVTLSTNSNESIS